MGKKKIQKKHGTYCYSCWVAVKNSINQTGHRRTGLMLRNSQHAATAAGSYFHLMLN